VGNVVWMWDKKNAFRVLMEETDEKDKSENLNIDGRIMLNIS
jgi:hypothetical protein